MKYFVKNTNWWQICPKIIKTNPLNFIGVLKILQNFFTAIQHCLFDWLENSFSGDTNNFLSDFWIFFILIKSASQGPVSYQNGIDYIIEWFLSSIFLKIFYIKIFQLWKRTFLVWSSESLSGRILYETL